MASCQAAGINGGVAHGWNDSRCACLFSPPWRYVASDLLDIMRLLSSMSTMSTVNFVRGIGTMALSPAHIGTHHQSAVTCYQPLGAALLMSIVQFVHRAGAGIHLTGLGGLACPPLYGMASAVTGGVHSFQETAESRLYIRAFIAIPTLRHGDRSWCMPWMLIHCCSASSLSKLCFSDYSSYQCCILQNHGMGT